MSYTIVYRRQFVTAPNETLILPLVLMGDNNCYDMGIDSMGRQTMRRTRHWTPLVQVNGNLLSEPEDLIAKIESWCNGSEHFKFHDRWLDDNGLRTFIRNGCKNAMSFDQMQEADKYHRRPALTLIIRDYGDPSCISKPVYHGIIPEDQLISCLKKLDAYRADHSETKGWAVSFDFGTEEPVIKERKKIHHDELFVIKLPATGTYFTKFIDDRSMLATCKPLKAKTFTTQKAAMDFIQKNNKRLFYKGQEPVIEKVQNPD